MSTLPRVTLKPRRARPFFARHPWVFVTSIENVTGEPAPGRVLLLNVRLFRVFDRPVQRVVRLGALFAGDDVEAADGAREAEAELNHFALLGANGNESRPVPHPRSSTRRGFSSLINPIQYGRSPVNGFVARSYAQASSHMCELLVRDVGDDLHLARAI